MGYVTALLTLLTRLFRPTRGVHVSPYGYLWGLAAELRRRRSHRVRKYITALPCTADAESRAEPTPLIPAPRRPLDDGPPSAHSSVRVQPTTRSLPRGAETQVDIVRGPYRAWEAREALRRTNGLGFGLTALREPSPAGHTGVTA
ncbi:hypothetical protein [Nocardiopsis oceani]